MRRSPREGEKAIAGEEVVLENDLPHQLKKTCSLLPPNTFPHVNGVPSLPTPVDSILPTQIKGMEDHPHRDGLKISDGLHY